MTITPGPWKVNTQGGYKTDTEVMDAIDAYRRAKLAASQ